MSNIARNPGATAPGAAGGFVGSLLGIFFGVVIGGLIGAVVTVLGAVFNLAAFGLNKALKREIVSLDVVTEEPVANAEADSVGTQQSIPDLPPDLQWNKRFEEQTRKRVELGKVDVDLWFYPNLGKVTRTVRVRNKALLAKLGERMRLADIETNDLVQAELQTIQEIEALLEGYKPKAKAKSQEVKPSEQVQTKIEKAAVLENTQNNPAEEVPVVKSSTAAPKAKVVQKQPQTKKLVYRGNLLKYGMEQHSDANGGQYSCYCIHIDDFDANAAQKIVGTDLERAIKESGAEIGDAIEVALVGETQTFNHGNRGKKKLWSVVKL